MIKNKLIYLVCIYQMCLFVAGCTDNDISAPTRTEAINLLRAVIAAEHSYCSRNDMIANNLADLEKLDLEIDCDYRWYPVYRKIKYVRIDSSHLFVKYPTSSVEISDPLTSTNLIMFAERHQECYIYADCENHEVNVIKRSEGPLKFPFKLSPAH